MLIEKFYTQKEDVYYKETFSPIEKWAQLELCFFGLLKIVGTYTIVTIDVMKPAHKKIEKIDQHLRIQPLRGGNLLYITQMNDSLMIQMIKPPFYI